jgi:hypothetical protein
MNIYTKNQFILNATPHRMNGAFNSGKTFYNFNIETA